MIARATALAACVAMAATISACAGRSYLGRETPAACSSDAAHCAGWLDIQDLDAGELDVYDDDGLREYVQSIADRLALSSHLEKPPHITISDHDGTYAPFGDRVVIGRITLQKLGTEAEVAAVVAHEMAHVEGHHATVSLFGPDADASWLQTRRDAEGIADERAVALLERAGYTPSAMPRALAAELEADDDEHPPRADRIARVASLANHRTQGVEGRTELLKHEDHMIVGRDTRLGQQVDGAWVIASLRIAMQLAPNDVTHVDGDTLELHHERASLTMYAIGEPWAKEVAEHLENRQQAVTRLGLVTVGVATVETPDDIDPLARLEHAVRQTLPRPPAGTWVVVLDRCIKDGACGGIVLEITANGDFATRNRWLASLRGATLGELEAAEPPRVALVQAPVAGLVKELVHLCADPATALTLDNAERPVAVGEPIKCTDHRYLGNTTRLMALDSGQTSSTPSAANATRYSSN